MSLVKQISPKALYVANCKLLQTIFHHSPEIPNTTPVSYFNSILIIHKVIFDDLAGTCEIPITTVNTEPTIDQVFQSLHAIEQMIFGESIKGSEAPSVAGCLKRTEHIISKLESNQNSCTLL